MKIRLSVRHAPRPSIALRVGLLALLAAPLSAQPIEVRNDSIRDFGSAAVQAGFVAGERGAAWLTPACDAELVAVRILWLDQVSSGSQTLGESITISQAGPFPVPGAPLLELLAPVMTEGNFNEFVVVPPIPVAAGTTVVVDFKFFNTPPPIGPSLVTDTDGCQTMKNGVFAIPPSSWLDLCPFGVSGDLAIRAVVTCETLIFADGFESGDTSAWSSTVPFAPVTEWSSYPILQIESETLSWRIPQNRN